MSFIIDQEPINIEQRAYKGLHNLTLPIFLGGHRILCTARTCRHSLGMCIDSGGFKTFCIAPVSMQQRQALDCISLLWALLYLQHSSSS